MKFCSYCGRQLNEGETCTCPGALEEQKAKTNKFSKVSVNKIKKLAMPVAVLLVVVIAVICLVSYAQTEIDLEEYIVIKGVTGLNGQGMISYHLDKSALNEVLLDNEDYSKINDKNYEEVMGKFWAEQKLADDAMKCISLEASKKAGLSNGDVVTITASFENTNNIKLPYHFKDASIKYTVSGLADGMTIDPFAEEFLVVSFSGFNGQGKAVVEVLTDEVPISLFSYRLSQDSNLHNNDTVTVTASVNEDALLKAGYFMPEKLEKAFLVADLDEYFSVVDGIPADVLEELCRVALERTQEEELKAAEDDYLIINTSQVCGACFLQVEDPSVVQHKWDFNLELNNAVVVITTYTVERTGFWGFTRDYTYAWVFPNFSEAKDGTIAYQAENTHAYRYQDRMLDGVLDKLQEEYTDMQLVEASLPDAFIPEESSNTLPSE